MEIGASKASTSKKRKRMRTTGTLDVDPVDEVPFGFAKGSGGIDGFRRFRMGFGWCFFAPRLQENHQELQGAAAELQISSCLKLRDAVFFVCVFPCVVF